MTRRTRAQRLTAISLTGGAVLSLLAAPPALAGDAESTGNSSSTDHSQTLTATPGSDPTVADVGGGTSNSGVAAANTGAVGGEGITVEPGDAHSAGNESSSRLDQSTRSSASGGGISVFRQRAFILNGGAAVADTGFSAGGGITTGNAWALGNSSRTSVSQWAVTDDTDGALRLIDQRIAVANLGAAVAETGFNVGDSIETGDATATGDIADTTATQGGVVTGAPTGPVIVRQRDDTLNAGAGAANTGHDETAGDDSTNDPE